MNKTPIDMTAATTAGASLFGMLPEMAALIGSCLSIVWFCIRIYETETVKKLLGKYWRTIIDPITISAAIGVASSAFNAIKQGFAIGRDIEQMSGDLSRWMGAVSDIDNAEKQAKNPPLFKKLFNAQSIEQAAIEAYAAKKKLEEQRYELKIFLNMTYGINAYNELLAMEGQIRKERQELVYKQQRMRQQIFEIVGWIFVGALVLGFFALVAKIWINKARAAQPINIQDISIIRQYND